MLHTENESSHRDQHPFPLLRPYCFGTLYGSFCSARADMQQFDRNIQAHFAIRRCLLGFVREDGLCSLVARYATSASARTGRLAGEPAMETHRDRLQPKSLSLRLLEYHGHRKAAYLRGRHMGCRIARHRFIVLSEFMANLYIDRPLRVRPWPVLSAYPLLCGRLRPMRPLTDRESWRNGRTVCRANGAAHSCGVSASSLGEGLPAFSHIKAWTQQLVAFLGRQRHSPQFQPLEIPWQRTERRVYGPPRSGGI